jgi:tetratricopeptide (TPR) repeat protein
MVQSDLSLLKDAIERLIADNASAQDRERVQSAIAAGALSIATGQRAVSLGGDANGAVIVTGDENVIVRVDSVAAIAWLLHRGHPSPLHQLPADVADFAGRAMQVEKLLAVLSEPSGRAAIEGMGGLGKTTLAVHVAHRLTGRYPDAQIVVDMARTSAPLTPEQALARVIRVFEPLMQLPGTVAELRPIFLSMLRGKRVLLILDNAHDGDKVAPLAPPENCALIVTSRRRIAVAGLVRVNLDLLALEEAAGLLGSIVGKGRATAAELSRIAELCGLLPLALRVAGMFLVENPHWTAAEFSGALANERERLTRLRLEGNESLDVAASLALSVRELRGTHPGIADHWHELAVFPAGFDVAAAASVWDQQVTAARDGLGLLLSRSMVLYDTTQQRWRLHDLMRDLAGLRTAVDVLLAPRLAQEHSPADLLVFAVEKRHDLAERLTAARRRHAEHYCGVLAAANDLYIKGGEQVMVGLGLFDRERRNIETGQAWAAAGVAADPAAERLCVRYPLDGAHVLDLRQHPRQRIAWLETAVTAARKIGVRGGEGNALGSLGIAYKNLGEPRRAIECYEQVLSIMREIGDRRGEGNTLGNLGIAYAHLGEPRRAIEFYEQHLAIAREIGDRRGEGNTLGTLGNAYGDLGEPRRAIEFYEQHLATAREIGDRGGEGIALGSLGNAYRDLGEPRRAIEFYEQYLAIAREIGNRRGEGNTLGNLGIAYAHLSEPRRAIEFFEQALVIAREISDRHGEGNALGNLGIAYGDLGETRRAIEFYEQRLVIAREIGDRRGEGNALANLGNAYAHLSEPRRAIEFYEQRLVIAREIGDRRGEGNALANLGNAYAHLSEPRRAIEFYEQHLAIAREIGDRRGEGNTLGNLGNAYKNLGETRRAIEFFREAVVIYEAIESPSAAKVRATIAELENKPEEGDT